MQFLFRRSKKEIAELDMKEAKYTKEQKEFKKKHGQNTPLSARLAGEAHGRRASAACTLM